MNMVMTFSLHPLSHYNSITGPRTGFLLSFLEHFTIDFPSHFILSIRDVYLDSASHDKLIFPSVHLSHDKLIFLDYPSCERLRTVSRDELMSAFYEHLRTMSRDELMSAFCEHPSVWGERQFTPCRPFAKDPRFMNMVMTFSLHPLSHYNSIIGPRARFLLSLLEHFTIDFPSHFILSIRDVYLDSASHDKLIFPSAITRILRHFSIHFPSSDHFTVMCAIDYATVKHSEA